MTTVVRVQGDGPLLLIWRRVVLLYLGDSEDKVTLATEVGDVTHDLFVVMSYLELDSCDISNSIWIELTTRKANSSRFS